MFRITGLVEIIAESKEIMGLSTCAHLFSTTGKVIMVAADPNSTLHSGLLNHLIFPACRARCILAVLIAQAQAGQDVSEMDIALASLTQTRSAQLRARKRGMLLQDSI